MDKEKQRAKITIIQINRRPRQIQYEGQRINVWEGQAMLNNIIYYFSKLLKPSRYLPFREGDIIDVEYYIQTRYDEKRDKTWENLRITRVFGVEGKFSRETFQKPLINKKILKVEEYLKEIADTLFSIENNLSKIKELLEKTCESDKLLDNQN